MLPDIPKISVLMISYNQEQVVGRALDSLLSQKDYLFEICINDDCSTDDTYNVLLEYQNRYPDLVKPVRNPHNLGIFQNVEARWERPTGDIIYNMSGDDEAGEDYFRQVLEFIKEKQIDYKNELFCIYGDYKEIEPDGSSIVYSNKLVEGRDALKLKVRKLLSNRSACFSKKVLDKFEKVSEGRSFNAELVQDVQLALFTEKNYYIPIVGNIYYAGIGVSTRMNKKERHDNIMEGYRRFVEFITAHGYIFDKKDLAFIEFMKAYRSKNKKQALKHYLASIDLSLGMKGLGLDRVLYVLKKKPSKSKKQ